MTPTGQERKTYGTRGQRRDRGSNAALFAELRSKASGGTGRPRIAYIYHLVSFIL